MKIKQILALSVIAGSTLSIVACNSGHQSLPETNYGGIISIESQDLKLLPGTGGTIGTTIPVSLLYKQMLNTGNYGESLGAGANFGLPTQGYESANIANTQTDFNVDVSQGAFPDGANSTFINAYSVKYNAPGQNSQTDPSQIQRTASGMIIVPVNKAIRGVVVYYHPTVFGKNQVPSCIMFSSTQESYCAQPSPDPTGFGTLANLAAVYASRGFAVVAPDYIGLGSDWNNVHPYVAYPENNALSAFYMFPALRQILAEKGVESTRDLPLMITGYSEGGAYVLKASQIAQGSYSSLLSNNHLALKISSPQEGAYSLMDQMNFDFDNLSDGISNCANLPVGSNYQCGESSMVDLDTDDDDNTIVNLNDTVARMNNWKVVDSIHGTIYKPNLTSYVLEAGLYYNFNNLTAAYNYAMNPKFWQNIKINGQVVDLYELYSGNAINYTGAQISTAITLQTIGIEPYGVGEPLPLGIYTPFDLPGDPPSIIVQNALYGFGQNNQGSLYMNLGIKTSPQFLDVINNGSTYNWTTRSPVNFIHMNYDSAVTVINTYQAYSCMKYGKSFAGDAFTAPSEASCNVVSVNNSQIESTVIHNAPMINNLFGLLPITSVNGVYGTAMSKYWISPVLSLGSVEFNLNSFVPESQASNIANLGGLGLTFDHGDMFVLGNIVAMCTFENMLKDGTNSGVCPTLVP